MPGEANSIWLDIDTTVLLSAEWRWSAQEYSRALQCSGKLTIFQTVIQDDTGWYHGLVER